MLINNNTDIETEKHVKFVSYDGRYPSLCCGGLVLKIDGKECKFGYDWNFKDNSNHYLPFWNSGGGLDENYYPYENEWVININDIPEEFRKYAHEIDRVFNDNVSYGCCGGCS